MIGIEHIEQDASGAPEQSKLLQAIRHFMFGRHEAFEYIYQSTSPQLMLICRRYAANQDEAKDLLQESFIKIYKNLRHFDVNAPFELWAKRIAINTAIDHYRKNLQRSFRSLENVDPADEEEIFVTSDFLRLDIEKVLTAIQELPDGYRIVLNLYVLENKSHREISELLQISESTSRSQLTKARKAIKSRFENESR